MGLILKLIKSRFFIITLAAALLLSIVPGVLCAMGQGSYVRSAIITVGTPFRWAFTKIGEGLSGFALYFKTVDALRAENEALRGELEDYRNLVYDAELIKDCYGGSIQRRSDRFFGIGETVIHTACIFGPTACRILSSEIQRNVINRCAVAYNSRFDCGQIKREGLDG